MTTRIKTILGVAFIVSNLSGNIAIAESKPAASWFIVPQNKHVSEEKLVRKRNYQNSKKGIAGFVIIKKQDKAKPIKNKSY